MEEVGVRRFGISVGMVLAVLFALPGGAQASFHENNVNEVMLASATGDSSVQFVEFFDPVSEPFPSFDGPYGLTIYNAAGTSVGSQTFTTTDASHMASASSVRPFLISTANADTAFGVPGDVKLTVSLPKTAGQACYTAMGGTAFSCITWGCITHFVGTSFGTGSFHGAVPPNGKSAQRQNDNSVQIADPTPKAANVAGTSPTACNNPPPPPFAGVQIPKQTVTVANNKVPVSVKCPAKAKGSCVGKLTLKTKSKVKDDKGNKRIVMLGSASFTIAAGKTKTVKVKLSKAGKFVMAHHKSVKTTATAKSHDSRNKSKTTTGAVKVKQAP
jgi:hypothetical protein